MSSSRRSFLRTTAAAGAAAWASPLVARAGKSPATAAATTSNMHLSLAAYSMRDALQNGEMDLFAFIDWCAELGIPGTELTSYYFEEGFDRVYLKALQHRAFVNGLTVSGTAIRNDFCMPPGPEKDAQIEHVREWIGNAERFFAPHIRIFAGNLPEGADREEGIEWVAEGIKAVLPHAAEHGVMVGLENHGGITARAADHLAICDAVGDHPWFGINLDTGNYRTNAYQELEMAAPRAVNVQVKAMVVGDDDEKVPVDLERIRDILVAADYHGWVALEYEEEEPAHRIPEYLERMKVVFG